MKSLFDQLNPDIKEVEDFFNEIGSGKDLKGGWENYAIKHNDDMSKTFSFWKRKIVKEVSNPR